MTNAVSFHPHAQRNVFRRGAMQVLPDELKATKGIWDINEKCMIQIPDEKIRQDAALVILAYEWAGRL